MLKIRLNLRVSGKARLRIGLRVKAKDKNRVVQCKAMQGKVRKAKARQSQDS
jgi:hypothetical protein